MAPQILNWGGGGPRTSCEVQGCFIISGVLDNIPSSINNDNYSFRYSTLTVTPGLILTQCDDIQPLNITCGVSGHAPSVIGLKPQSLPFRIAGIV